MQEVEAKILGIDRGKVEAQLIALGASRVFDDVMEAFFYDFADSSIIKAGNVLRVRREGREVVLTYKVVSATGEAKVAQEHAVVVSDLAAVQRILEALGLVLVESMQKHRVSYKLKDARFDIDKYTGKYSYIPEFMEIEAENPQVIHRYAEKLGFKTQDCLPWSTVQVIDYYADKQKKSY
ncbi:MAG: class IV adenylate cyclase [Candidatus Bathyarchaeota archaeon]|nr:class IV adenylate cyclase [Candidatus Bathyarchaeota archaeon]